MQGSQGCVQSKQLSDPNMKDLLVNTENCCNKERIEVLNRNYWEWYSGHGGGVHKFLELVVFVLLNGIEIWEPSLGVEMSQIILNSCRLCFRLLDSSLSWNLLLRAPSFLGRCFLHGFAISFSSSSQSNKFSAGGFFWMVARNHQSVGSIIIWNWFPSSSETVFFWEQSCGTCSSVPACGYMIALGINPFFVLWLMYILHFCLPARKLASKQMLQSFLKPWTVGGLIAYFLQVKFLLMIKTQFSFVSAANLHEFLQSSWCMQVTVPFMSVLTPEHKFQNWQLLGLVGSCCQ